MTVHRIRGWRLGLELPIPYHCSTCHTHIPNILFINLFDFSFQ